MDPAAYDQGLQGCGRAVTPGTAGKETPVRGIVKATRTSGFREKHRYLVTRSSEVLRNAIGTPDFKCGQAM
jgi:hypothetical protein